MALTKVKGSVWDSADNNLGVNVLDFSGADDTAKFQALATYVGTLTLPVNIIIPGGRNYTINTTISLVLPEGTVIDASGATFTCTHNGVAFDINSEATALIPFADTTDDYTKRDITWNGGRFLNTNVTKTASVAIQAYYMRGFFLNDFYAADFYAGVKFGGKDTYIFTNCYTFNCVRHYWVPAAGVLFDAIAGNSGNDAIMVCWNNCHLSVNGDEAGIYGENRILGLSITNTTFNGTCTVAQVRVTDSPYIESRGFKVSNGHFEQIGSGYGVLFDATNGFGHRTVSFDGGTEFISGTAGWTGVQTDKCLDLYFGSCYFNDGSGGATEKGISLDSDSRKITISKQCTFTGIASGSEVVLQAAADRQHVTVLPEFTPDAVVLIGYNGATKSTGTETIDMSTAYTNWSNFILPPKAYAVSIQARDTASTSSTTNLRVLKDNTVGVSTGVGMNLTAVTNNNNRQSAGIVQADANGDLYLSYTASGAGTLTIFVNINGVYM